MGNRDGTSAVQAIGGSCKKLVARKMTSVILLRGVVLEAERCYQGRIGSRASGRAFIIFGALVLLKHAVSFAYESGSSHFRCNNIR